MPGCHILVEALDGIGTREFAELLVHVVGSGTRVVAEPDAEVLHLERLLLADLHGGPPAQRQGRGGQRQRLQAVVSSHSACHLDGY